MTPAVDFMGRTIEAGHVVVYPVRRGSDMWLNKLSVIQVTDDRITGYSPTGKLLTIQKLQNVVIVGGQPNGPCEASNDPV
jgi:hypothetical protein